MNSIIKEVTQQIITRSLPSRKAYLQDVEKMFEEGVYRSNLSCGNLAHAFAGCDHSDKEQLSGSESKNLDWLLHIMICYQHTRFTKTILLN